MSDKKEDFALYCPVKNEEARKRLGIKAGFFWVTVKKLSVAVSRCIAAMDDKGYDEDDFKKPVRVNFPVVNDLPPEGVFDTEFCNRYEKGGEDGITMTLIPGMVPADQFHEKTAETPHTRTSDNIDTETGDNVAGNTDALPAYAYNVNGELMSDVEKEMSQPVSGLALPLRYLAQCATDSVQHQITPERLRELHSLEMDPDSHTGSILLAIQNHKAQLEKLDTKNLHSLASYIGKVFPKDKQPQLNDLINFIDAVVSTEHIDRGLLVKEWQKGNRVSRIIKPTANDAPEPQETKVVEAVESARPCRSEKPTFRTINYELACGFYEDLDLNNLRPAMDFAKRIIAEDREDWKRMSATVGIIPDIKGYDRQTIIDLVRKAPKAVHNGNPDLRRTWCESFLAVHGVRDPDWYEYTPDNTPTTHEENAARISQAGKCLHDIEAGRFQCDEEKPQPADELADEPAAPETVEQDTTEHHPDPQPLENEPPVSQTEAGYQKIRAELHEARKNIPPKNPVDVGKQLAAARGEYVEGISDPNDPKWVKTETSPRTNKPELVTKVADGIFDVTALLQGSSIHGEKQEVETAVSEPKMPETKPVPQYTWPEYFEPGRYEGVPNDIYHAANGISSTMVKDARVSLMYYEGRHVSKTIKKERSKVLDMGNLVHALALQPEILDEEFSIEPEIPEGALTTTATIRAVIDEYNASLTPQLSSDEIKVLLEEYNSSLPQPVPLGDDVAQTGENYMSIPPEFQRVEEGQKVTAAKMKACIKEYNATLPTQMKTSGSRDALLEQLAIINPDLVAQEAQKPQPLKVSGTKTDLIQAVKSVKPDAVFADELLDAWRENPDGKVLVTRQQYETALAIQSALYDHPEAGKLLQNPTRAVEVSYFGIDDDTGLEIRVRPDVELEYEGLRIGFDLKTISMWDVKEDALKSRLHREITMRDYHLSAGMYCNVADLDKFAWIFVNKDEGYHWVAVVWASDSLLELGKLEYHQTILAIANAMDTGEWPAPITEDYKDELNDYDMRRLNALREMA
ncbi:TPA: RecE family exodeoxyribonuclease [Salmonella enterica]|nr:PD-(D/E)XK nuclease-like domain-containing protein [Salmonella enterica subsp. enterica serovar Orientalis]